MALQYGFWPLENEIQNARLQEYAILVMNSSKKEIFIYHLIFQITLFLKLDKLRQISV